MALAGLALIDRKGFAATTVEEIAAAADYSAATFFRLFPRKEDVVFFDLPERLEVLKAALADPSRGPAWPLIRRLFLADAAEWDRNEAALATPRVELLHREPALFSRFLEHCQDWEDVVARLLAGDADRDPEDLEIRVAAGAVLAATRAALRAQRISGGSFAGHLELAVDALEAGPLRRIQSRPRPPARR